MKIIKQGSKEKVNRTKRFVCNKCGCEFEANYGEYENASQLEMIHDNISAKCRCPFCKYVAYAYGR